MPNRIIKESICTSENIDQLSAFNETVFYRLIVNVDDYGRIDARPKLLAAKLFPLKDIRATQIEDALRKLTSAELVTLYVVDGKPFLQMNTWDRHQTIRAKKSKCPEPESGLKASEIICKQLQADASKCSRNPIQSNPIQTNPKKKDEEDEDEDNNARAREIADEWKTSFGDKPTPALINRIEAAADGMEAEAIRRAIRIAAVRSDKNTKSYLMSLLQDWQSKKLKTADDVDQYLALSDTANGVIAIGNAEQARQDLHEFLDRKKTDGQQIDRMFEKVWALYPLKHSRAKAYEQFVRLDPDTETLADIINAITRQRKSGPWLEGKMETLASWLRLERWKDTVKSEE